MFAGRLLLVLIPIAALQSGCALWMSEPPPADIDSPVRYPSAPSPMRGFTPAPDWWRAFGSAELTDLVERANAQNYDLAAATARIRQADSQTFVTTTLLLPSGGATFRRSSVLPSARSADGEAAFTLPETHQWRLSGGLSYEIDFWGKNAALVLASQRSALASRFNRDVVELSLVATLVNTYLEILATQDRLRITAANLRLATRVRNLIDQRVKAGTSTIVELVQQDAVVAQQRTLEPRLGRVLRQDIAALGTLLGATPDRVAVRGGGLDRVRAPVVAPGLPSELLLQRPDIRQAETQLAAAAANLASARVALLPSVQLTGEKGWESALLRTLVTREAAFYSLAASAAQPIFDLPRLAGQVELQRATQDELLQRYRQSIIVGFTEVERALIGVRESAREEALTRQQLAVARRAYELSITQLDAGAIDVTTILNIQRTLFDTEDAVAQIRLLRLQAIVGLYQALGGGWKLVPVAPPLALGPRHE